MNFLFDDDDGCSGDSLLSIERVVVGMWKLLFVGGGGGLEEEEEEVRHCLTVEYTTSSPFYHFVASAC